MGKNVNEFKELLNRKDLYMEEGQNEDGSSFFRIEQKLKDGGSIVLVVGFSESEDVVDIYAFDIAEIKDAYKKESALKLINELNRDYRYSKFTMEEDGRISGNYSISFEENFNPDIVLRQLILALESAEEVYPKFMKLVWA